jgi:hypothetical protein
MYNVMLDIKTKLLAPYPTLMSPELHRKTSEMGGKIIV